MEISLDEFDKARQDAFDAGRKVSDSERSEIWAAGYSEGRDDGWSGQTPNPYRQGENK